MSHNDEFAFLPPLREQYDPNCDTELEIAAEEMAEEIEEYGVPTHLIRLTKGVDQLQVRAFARVRLIVFTYPRVKLACGAEYVGSVREQHVGHKHMASPETFRAYFEQHVATMVRAGWKIA